MGFDPATLAAIGALAGGGAAVYSATQKPKMPDMPKPTVESPAATEVGDVMDASKRLRKRKGRSATIVTGDLVPTDIGYKTLLG